MGEGFGEGRRLEKFCKWILESRIEKIFASDRFFVHLPVSYNAQRPHGLVISDCGD